MQAVLWVQAYAAGAAQYSTIPPSSRAGPTTTILQGQQQASIPQLPDKLLFLVVQVHDEVILEGPKESAEEAQKIVVECMENPFDGRKKVLKVALEVSSNIADTWYEAK